MRIVHEGRGGHVEPGKARYPLELVEGGCFAIHFPAGQRAGPVRDRHLEELCRAQPERFTLERKDRRR